jgi:hypothetical protein
MHAGMRLGIYLLHYQRRYVCPQFAHLPGCASVHFALHAVKPSTAVRVHNLTLLVFSILLNLQIELVVFGDLKPSDPTNTFSVAIGGVAKYSLSLGPMIMEICRITMSPLNISSRANFKSQRPRNASRKSAKLSTARIFSSP